MLACMDAVDQLLCLGFEIAKPPCNDEYRLAGVPVYPFGSPEHMAIVSAFKEIGEQPEFYKKLIQNKGIANGI